jgi:cytochrome c oxidase subunit 2
MNLGFPLFPEQASTVAPRVDALYFVLIAVSVFFVTLISLAIIIFAFRYRRRSESDQPPEILSDLRLEVLWTVIPLAFTLSMFVWGAKLYFETYSPPPNALEIHVVAKQWMWKAQHPEGRSEIDELHVPVGRPIKLLLTSQDVIHDFFVPAFRVKTDVLPGRYMTVWFQASKVGVFRLFCAEYCGTQHSGMLGRILVLAPREYQNWLGGGPSGVTRAEAGAKLFQSLGCVTCHAESKTSRGPSLAGLPGKQVRLQDGKTIIADETYIRESVINPQAKIVAGFQPIMPTFKGLITEEGISQIISYLKSIDRPEEGERKNK